MSSARKVHRSLASLAAVHLNIIGWSFERVIARLPAAHNTAVSRNAWNEARGALFNYGSYGRISNVSNMKGTA